MAVHYEPAAQIIVSKALEKLYPSQKGIQTKALEYFNRYYQQEENPDLQLVVISCVCLVAHENHILSPFSHEFLSKWMVGEAGFLIEQGIPSEKPYEKRVPKTSIASRAVFAQMVRICQALVLEAPIEGIREPKSVPEVENSFFVENEYSMSELEVKFGAVLSSFKPTPRRGVSFERITEFLDSSKLEDVLEDEEKERRRRKCEDREKKTKGVCD